MTWRDYVSDYHYDLNNNVIKFRHGNGRTTQKVYDAQNRLTDIKEFDKNGQTSYTLKYGYDAVGNVVYQKDTGGFARTIESSYDSLNRLVSDNSSTQGMVTYTYDNASNCTSMKVGNNPALIYEHNALNQVIKVGNSGAYQ